MLNALNIQFISIHHVLTLSSLTSTGTVLCYRVLEYRVVLEDVLFVCIYRYMATRTYQVQKKFMHEILFTYTTSTYLVLVLVDCTGVLIAY